MAHNYALEPDEVAAGYVLTCQSEPGHRPARGRLRRLTPWPMADHRCDPPDPSGRRPGPNHDQGGVPALAGGRGSAKGGCREQTYRAGRPTGPDPVPDRPDRPGGRRGPAPGIGAAVVGLAGRAAAPGRPGRRAGLRRALRRLAPARLRPGPAGRARPAQAEEVAQEALVEVWRTRGPVRPEQGLGHVVGADDHPPAGGRPGAVGAGRRRPGAPGRRGQRRHPVRRRGRGGHGEPGAAAGAPLPQGPDRPAAGGDHARVLRRLHLPRGGREARHRAADDQDADARWADPAARLPRVECRQHGEG